MTSKGFLVLFTVLIFLCEVLEPSNEFVRATLNLKWQPIYTDTQNSPSPQEFHVDNGDIPPASSRETSDIEPVRKIYPQLTLEFVLPVPTLYSPYVVTIKRFQREHPKGIFQPPKLA